MVDNAQLYKGNCGKAEEQNGEYDVDAVEDDKSVQ